MKKPLKHLISSFAVLAFGLCSTALQAQDSKEYLVKAAFIYNFVKFVDWPADKSVSKLSSIDICVLGQSPMNNTASIFKQGSTPKLALHLTSVSSADEAAGHCHVVFVSDGDADIASVLAALKGKPVLTVSDADGFAEQGGMIGFVVSDNKIKIVVNARAVSSAGLKVDAQLLEIALKVIGK